MDKKKTTTFVRFLGPSIAAILAAVALTAAVTAQSPNNPKADIQEGNAFRGFDFPALPVTGFVNYHRIGDTVQIQFHLKGARPNEEYDVSLWGDFCTPFGDMGSVTTNKNGVANFNGTIDVPAGTTRIFATAWNDVTGYNDTPAVELTSLPALKK